MKIIIDINLTPNWIEVFRKNGIEAAHWSKIGDPKAHDHVIMSWAVKNNHVVFTNDLDFGSLLAVTNAGGPSVIQIRTQDVLPEFLENVVIGLIEQYRTLLEQGALIVVDENKSRGRILPLNR